MKVILVLCALGFVGVDVSLAQTLPKAYSSYRTLPWCTPSDYIRYPTTASDVVAIVQEAIRDGKTVKAFGARHSQTDVICTEGIPIDNHGLKSFRLNPDQTVTVGAGVTLHDATEFLKLHGRAFKTTPAFGNITIGGAIGTGAHGSSIKYTSSISSQVVGLTIVDGLGNIRTISEESDLHAFRIHLGLLGIIVDVTLTTSPLYKTRGENHVVSDSVLTDGTVQDWARSADQMSIYWFPAAREVVVANWTIVDVSTPGEAYTNDHVPSSYDNFNFAISKATEIAFGLTATPCAAATATGYTIINAFETYLQTSLLKQTPDFVPIYTEDGYTVKMPAVGYYDKMFAPVCSDESQGPLGRACVWAHGNFGNITLLDNEFGLALSDLPAFITAVKDIISKTPTAFPLQGILMRFSASSTTFMSTAYGRDTVHFEFYLTNRVDRYEEPSGSLAGYQTILQTLVNQFNGRSHWGKSGLVYHNSESLAMKLPTAARQGFIDIMNKYDPNEVFINSFGKRLKGTGTKVDFDPLTTRCALLDNCHCSVDSDCGRTQKCTKVQGYNYNVCKTLNEATPSTVQFVSIPVLGFLNWVLNTVPLLANAVKAQCALLG